MPNIHDDDANSDVQGHESVTADDSTSSSELLRTLDALERLSARIARDEGLLISA